MVDNLKKILPLLTYKSKDDFYYLQILQRKKENPELGSNSRVIKNYYINNNEYLKKKYDEITNLCCLFNARASLRLNKRSYKKVAFKTMQNIANTMSNGEYSFIKKSYDRACGLGHNDSNKKWIIDIDGFIDRAELEFMLNDINNMQPINNKFKILAEIPSKSGIHIISNPFNIKEFNKKYNMDIHKDNPTNLYIP